MKAYVENIAVSTPGLTSWHEACLVFNHKQRFDPQPLTKYKPQLLPANERRRATSLIRLAFKVCEDIKKDSHLDMASLNSVFGSSGGDDQVIDQICSALCQPERVVSPTQFHNSVHNSAAGYWEIAVRSKATSTSISSSDFSFCASIIETLGILHDTQAPVLMVVYDGQPPEPLWQKHQVNPPFAVAVIFSPFKSSSSTAELNFNIEAGTHAETACKHADLKALSTSNPAARALPMLELLATRQSGTAVLNLASNQSLFINLEPCL